MPDKMSLKGSLLTGAREILDVLLNHGYKAYLVGGCVRDSLLGKPVKDIDIATSALPAEVMQLFPHTIPTGLQHGTIMIIQGSNAYEITTFRRESGYEQFRRPTAVEFISDLEEDLLRRDFTMNAMALDHQGLLIDPYEGKLDLERNTLRCVGDPLDRFNEDALRMMRCIRFASEYELTIADATWAALIDRRARLRHIAMERIRSELENIIKGSFPVKGLSILFNSKLYLYFKADLELSEQDWESILNSRHLVLADLKDESLRWAYLLLFADLGAARTKNILKKLTFSRKKTDVITAIIVFHEWVQTQKGNLDNKEMWIKASLLFNMKTVLSWLAIVKQWNKVNPKDAAGVFSWLKQITLENIQTIEENMGDMPIKTMKELAISGEQLLQIHGKPGVWIKHVLDKLMFDVAMRFVENDQELLLKKAESYYRCEYIQEKSTRNE